MKEHHHKSKNNLLLALDSNRRVLKKEFYKAKTTAVVQGKASNLSISNLSLSIYVFRPFPPKKGGDLREKKEKARREKGEKEEDLVIKKRLNTFLVSLREQRLCPPELCVRFKPVSVKTQLRRQGLNTINRKE